MKILDFFIKKKDNLEQKEKKIVYDQHQTLNVFINKLRSNEKAIKIKQGENKEYCDTINDIAGKIYTSERIDTSIKRSRNDDIIFQLNTIKEKKYTDWTIEEIEILEEHVAVIDEKDKSAFATYREGIIDIFDEEDD